MIEKYFIENLNPYQKENGNVTAQFCINTGDYTLLHSHADYWEFYVVTDGIVENHVNGEVRTYAPRTLFYCTTKDAHYLTIGGKKTARYVNFTVAEQTLLQMLAPLSDNTLNTLYRNDRSYPLSTETILEIETTLHKLNLLPPDECEKANDMLLTKIMFFVQIATSEIQNDEPKDDPVWAQTLNELKLSEEFLTYTVEDLCRKLNYSRVQLNRLFNARYGMSPHAYLLSNRLLYAQNLLNNTDMNTTEIANVIGYSNLAQFNVVFKNKFGVSPGQYRTECREKSIKHSANSLL